MSVAKVAISLGDEAPLSVDGEVGGVDRRRISVQWFSGTILTGLCGAALMGGAVYAALDGETNFATMPERVESALRGSIAGIGERLAAVTRKADRLPAAGETSTARNVIRISTTTRVGNREVVRVRPFVRVSANLALSVSDISANIPPFNPQKIMLGDSDASPTGEDTAAAEPDAEVSFVTRDLAPLLPRVKIAALVPIDEVIARVRDIGGFVGAPAPYATAAVGGVTGSLAYAPEKSNDPYAGFETRIVPENMTMLPKTSSQSGSGGGSEKVVAVKKGDTLASVLRDLGASAADIKSIAAVLASRGKDSALKEGQKLRVLLATIGGNIQPLRVIVTGDSTIDSMVALSDMGRYVLVDVQSADSQVANVDEQEEEEDDGAGVRLYQSIYETALRNQIPRPVIEEMIRVYSYDVDFQRKTMPGDSFEVLYAGEDEAPNADTKNDVMFAALSVGGEVKRFYRYQTTDDSIVDYYDETGKSAKKFLVRKPVANGIVRSGFGARRHPILGYTKMHTGVDWAAPMGTPIYAAGSGTIDKAGWEGGYGKYIRIKHANGYETAYGHMTAFARGMEPGKRVRQGQMIGFVGSTGLSTGAHVHYEILVNGRFVDPMRIRLPRGRALDGPLLANFEQERDRIDGMMIRTPARVAASAPAATTTASAGR